MSEDDQKAPRIFADGGQRRESPTVEEQLRANMEVQIRLIGKQAQEIRELREEHGDLNGSCVRYERVLDEIISLDARIPRNELDTRDALRDAAALAKAARAETDCASEEQHKIATFKNGTLNPCVEIQDGSEESVVAYVDELTGGLSAQAEAKLRALLKK